MRKQLDLHKFADAESLADYLQKLPKPMHHGHSESVESVRLARHAGHTIVIRTTYIVEVDGKVLPLHLSVDNAGNVHCHSLPNYRFASAVDMVKQVINSFPDDFPRRGRRTAGDVHPHGMKMGGKSKPARSARRIGAR